MECSRFPWVIPQCLSSPTLSTSQEGIFIFVPAKLNRIRRISRHQVPSQTLPCNFSSSSRCVWTLVGDAAFPSSSLRPRPSGSPLSASEPFLWVCAVLEPGAPPLPVRTPVPAWDTARGHHKVTAEQPTHFMASWAAGRLPHGRPAWTDSPKQRSCPDILMMKLVRSWHPVSMGLPPAPTGPDGRSVDVSLARRAQKGPQD